MNKLITLIAFLLDVGGLPEESQDSLMESNHLEDDIPQVEQEEIQITIGQSHEKLYKYDLLDTISLQPIWAFPNSHVLLQHWQCHIIDELGDAAIKNLCTECVALLNGRWFANHFSGNMPTWIPSQFRNGCYPIISPCFTLQGQTIAQDLLNNLHVIECDECSCLNIVQISNDIHDENCMRGDSFYYDELLTLVRQYHGEFIQFLSLQSHSLQVA